MKKLIICIIILIIGLRFSDTFGFTFGSELEITQHWQQHSPDSTDEVDHQIWDVLLNRYISTEQGINLFAYKSVTSADKTKLKHYLDYLQAANVSTLNRKQQFAYWINLYNASVIQVVLTHYPVASIQDISASLLFKGPWRKKRVEVEGIGLSLDNIEHQILRPIFKDNRVHYAVNCASIGCPNLQATAYTHKNLQALLDLGARQYINHPRGVWLHNGKLTVSSIFDWYAEDFGDDRQIIAHFMRFADAALQDDLQNHVEGRPSIDKYHYDWALNERVE